MEDLLKSCAELYRLLPSQDSTDPIPRQIKKYPQLKPLIDRITEQLHQCGPVNTPKETDLPTPPEGQTLKAVVWNIERGKKFENLLRTLKAEQEICGADFYFLTEVDWGMARSQNRNITAELGKALGYHAYFAPSYFNFTKGHGNERENEENNQIGLHGKAILSKYPLKNLRVVPMGNVTNKQFSKEARLGQKRALLGELAVGGKSLTLACTHLDAFSSPKTRAHQLHAVAQACQDRRHVLLGGDWNTNTLNSINTWHLILSVIYHLLTVPLEKMVREHHPCPENRFESPLFQMLKANGFEISNCNEIGVGTYELCMNDRELGEMAGDQFPSWALKWINRVIKKSGGEISLKLDWFAAKNLHCHFRKVSKFTHYLNRASDHYPIVVHFTF